MIKDLTDGSNASGIYLVKDFAKCLTNGGKAYLNLHFWQKMGRYKRRFRNFRDRRTC